MNYAHPEILVDTDWVAKNCLAEGVRLVEVDYDPENAYHQGHIRGATLLRWTDLAKPGWLACRLFEYAWEPGRDPYADSTGHDGSGAKKFGNLASMHGIEEDTKVVLYGDTYNWFAAYALWIFKMRGHENVCLMNGGRRKWEMDGLEYVRGETEVRPTRYRAASAGQSFWTYLGDLHHALLDSKVRLVDVRSPAEYSDEDAIHHKLGMGGTEGRWCMPGAVNTLPNGIHVRATYTEGRGRMPGAVNVPWLETVNKDGTFKSYDELRDLFESNGVVPGSNIVVCCRRGERAPLVWTVLKYLLGYPNVAAYDGSWKEWGTAIRFPITKSPS